MMRNPSYYIALAREAEQADRYTVAVEHWRDATVAAGKPGKYDSEIERVNHTLRGIDTLKLDC